MEIILLLALVFILGFFYKFNTNDVWARGYINSSLRYSIFLKSFVKKFTIQDNDKNTLRYHRFILNILCILMVLFILLYVYYFDSFLGNKIPSESYSNEKPLIIDFSRTEN